ncbi:MAG: DNA starvation/stationary phase protection protein Dps [Pseudomonadota bacterium]
MTLHNTKHDLSANTRQAIVTLLQARLVDAIDLAMQTKQAHWTVKGPSFIALHELFDKLNDTVTEHVDTIAERIAMLGGTPKGTVQVVAQESELSAYPLDITNGADHVDALSSAYAAFAKRLRAAMSEAGEIGDEDTVDLFTGASRDIDKALWFIEAHGQARA